MNKVRIRRSQEKAVVSFTCTNMLAVADLTCLKLPKAEKGRKLKLKIARKGKRKHKLKPKNTFYN